MNDNVWKAIPSDFTTRKQVLLIAVVSRKGRRYVTDVYAGWRTSVSEQWERWPHPFAPTHYAEVPGRDEFDKLDAKEISY